jgi:hypothetical protein
VGDGVVEWGGVESRRGKGTRRFYCREGDAREKRGRGGGRREEAILGEYRQHARARERERGVLDFGLFVKGGRGRGRKLGGVREGKRRGQREQSFRKSALYC